MSKDFILKINGQKVNFSQLNLEGGIRKEDVANSPLLSSIFDKFDTDDQKGVLSKEELTKFLEAVHKESKKHNRKNLGKREYKKLIKTFDIKDLNNKTLTRDQFLNFIKSLIDNDGKVKESNTSGVQKEEPSNIVDKSSVDQVTVQQEENKIPPQIKTALQRGETLEQLAERLGCSVEDLIQLNPDKVVDSKLELHEGDEIVVPDNVDPEKLKERKSAEEIKAEIAQAESEAAAKKSAEEKAAAEKAAAEKAAAEKAAAEKAAAAKATQKGKAQQATKEPERAGVMDWNEEGKYDYIKLAYTKGTAQTIAQDLFRKEGIFNPNKNAVAKRAEAIKKAYPDIFDKNGKLTKKITKNYRISKAVSANVKAKEAEKTARANGKQNAQAFYNIAKDYSGQETMNQMLIFLRGKGADGKPVGKAKITRNNVVAFLDAYDNLKDIKDRNIIDTICSEVMWAGGYGNSDRKTVLKYLEEVLYNAAIDAKVPKAKCVEFQKAFNAGLAKGSGEYAVDQMFQAIQFIKKEIISNKQAAKVKANDASSYGSFAETFKQDVIGEKLSGLRDRTNFGERIIEYTQDLVHSVTKKDKTKVKVTNRDVKHYIIFNSKGEMTKVVISRENGKGNTYKYQGGKFVEIDHRDDGISIDYDSFFLKNLADKNGDEVWEILNNKQGLVGKNKDAREKDGNLAKLTDSVMSWFGTVSRSELTEELGIAADKAEKLVSLAEQIKKQPKNAALKTEYGQIISELCGTEFNPKAIATRDNLIERADSYIQAKTVFNEVNKILAEHKKGSSLEGMINGSKLKDIINEYVKELRDESGMKTDADYIEAINTLRLRAQENMYDSLGSYGNFEQMEADINTLNEGIYGKNNLGRKLASFNTNMNVTDMASELAVEIAATALLQAVPGAGQAAAVAVAGKWLNTASKARKYKKLFDICMKVKKSTVLTKANQARKSQYFATGVDKAGKTTTHTAKEIWAARSAVKKGKEAEFLAKYGAEAESVAQNSIKAALKNKGVQSGYNAVTAFTAVTGVDMANGRSFADSVKKGGTFAAFAAGSTAIEGLAGYKNIIESVASTLKISPQYAEGLVADALTSASMGYGWTKGIEGGTDEEALINAATFLAFGRGLKLPGNINALRKSILGKYKAKAPTPEVVEPKLETQEQWMAEFRNKSKYSDEYLANQLNTGKSSNNPQRWMALRDVVEERGIKFKDGKAVIDKPEVKDAPPANPKTLKEFEKLVENSDDMSQVRAKLSNNPNFNKLTQPEQLQIMRKITAKERQIEFDNAHAENQAARDSQISRPISDKVKDLEQQFNKAVDDALKEGKTTFAPKELEAIDKIESELAKRGFKMVDGKATPTNIELYNRFAKIFGDRASSMYQWYHKILARIPYTKTNAAVKKLEKEINASELPKEDKQTLLSKLWDKFKPNKAGSAEEKPKFGLTDASQPVSQRGNGYTVTNENGVKTTTVYRNGEKILSKEEFNGETKYYNFEGGEKVEMTGENSNVFFNNVIQDSGRDFMIDTAIHENDPQSLIDIYNNRPKDTYVYLDEQMKRVRKALNNMGYEYNGGSWKPVQVTVWDNLINSINERNFDAVSKYVKSCSSHNQLNRIEEYLINLRYAKGIDNDVINSIIRDIQIQRRLLPMPAKAVKPTEAAKQPETKAVEEEPVTEPEAKVVEEEPVAEPKAETVHPDKAALEAQVEQGNVVGVQYYINTCSDEALLANFEYLEKALAEMKGMKNTNSGTIDRALQELKARKNKIDESPLVRAAIAREKRVAYASAQADIIFNAIDNNDMQGVISRLNKISSRKDLISIRKDLEQKVHNALSRNAKEDAQKLHDAIADVNKRIYELSEAKARAAGMNAKGLYKYVPRALRQAYRNIMALIENFNVRSNQKAILKMIDKHFNTPETATIRERLTAWLDAKIQAIKDWNFFKRGSKSADGVSTEKPIIEPEPVVADEPVVEIIEPEPVVEPVTPQGGTVIIGGSRNLREMPVSELNATATAIEYDRCVLEFNDKKVLAQSGTPQEGMEELANRITALEKHLTEDFVGWYKHNGAYWVHQKFDAINKNGILHETPEQLLKSSTWQSDIQQYLNGNGEIIVTNAYGIKHAEFYYANDKPIGALINQDGFDPVMLKFDGKKWTEIPKENQHEMTGEGGIQVRSVEAYNNAVAQDKKANRHWYNPKTW